MVDGAETRLVIPEITIFIPYVTRIIILHLAFDEEKVLGNLIPEGRWEYKGLPQGGKKCQRRALTVTVYSHTQSHTYSLIFIKHTHTQSLSHTQ